MASDILVNIGTVIKCHLLGDKPLPQPMIIMNLLDP